MIRPPPFDAFVAPARAYPQVWRLVLGVIVAVAFVAAWLPLTWAMLRAVTGSEAAAGWFVAMTEPRTPTTALLLLSTFLGMWVGALVAARVLHRRGWRSLIGPRGAVARDFLRALGVTAAVYALGIALWALAFDSTANLTPAIWASFLPLALLGLLVQTGAEEVLFRGYLMQQLAARFASPVVWMGLPSLLFGALHYDPGTMGSAALAVVAQTAGFGLIAADLTRRTGNLGAAWGLHFANNVIAILVIATQGTITGLALRLTPYTANEADLLVPLMAGDAAMLVAVWSILRRMLR